jgi:hypothetical protein
MPRHIIQRQVGPGNENREGNGLGLNNKKVRTYVCGTGNVYQERKGRMYLYAGTGIEYQRGKGRIYEGLGINIGKVREVCI